MWDQIFKRWLDLVFWWLPKQGVAERPAAAAPEQPAPVKPQPSATEQAVPQRVMPEPVVPEPVVSEKATSPAPDDLTVIKGIGPVVQRKLHALGIRTFHDLAAADPDALAEQLKGRQPISPALVRGWTEAADR